MFSLPSYVCAAIYGFLIGKWGWSDAVKASFITNINDRESKMAGLLGLPSKESNISNQFKASAPWIWIDSIVFGKNGWGINGRGAMFYFARAADTGINFQMQCDLSVWDTCWEIGVLCGERNVFALYSDDRVRGVNKMEQGEPSYSQRSHWGAGRIDEAGLCPPE